MNRTQAVERVDEILQLFAQMYGSGRCPRCEVLLYEAEDDSLPAGTSTVKRVAHRGTCEMGSCTDELMMLTRRFGIGLEPVILTLPDGDTWIATVKRAVELDATRDRS